MAEGNGRLLHGKAMGTSEVCITPRLKREECNRPKHDSDFSKWEILVGPSDWKDHSLGKEGAERYRVHNLPTSSGSGVYELGIAVSQTGLGREVGKLDPDRIIVVYLGQADNVRTRLQSYGRSGAHLGSHFEDIFSKGHSLVFRWAPIRDKRDAEKTEAQLLDKFDYPWNKGSNGPRRPNDVKQKLDEFASRTTRFPNIARKQVGIIIKARKPLLPQNESSTCIDEESDNPLPQVFKHNISRHKLILIKSQVCDEDSMPTCGATLDDGTTCRRPPVPQRKRCEEHKWRKNGRSISNSVTDGKSSYVHDVVLDSSSRNDQDYDTCGITLDDGTPCRRPPLPQRKRCEEHKWRKNGRSISNSVTDAKSSYVHDVVLDSSSRNDQDYDTCGLDLGNGIYCRKLPVARRKRCEEHKGMKVNGLASKLAAEEKSHVSNTGSGFSTSSQLIKEGKSQPLLVSYRSDVNNNFSSTCGATNLDGSLCRRQPVEGRKRCWQHSGMRADSSISMFDLGSSLECGATLRNGSACTRAPAHGGKRCWQHKGMRASTSYYF